MPTFQREYRMLDGIKHHQCPDCRCWKPSTKEFFASTGRGGLSLRRTCKPCQLSPAAKERRKAAIEMCDRRFRVTQVGNTRLYTFEKPQHVLAAGRMPSFPPPPNIAAADGDVYAPSLFDISTAPPLGFLFADFDATLGLRFDPVDPD